MPQCLRDGNIYFGVFIFKQNHTRASKIFIILVKTLIESIQIRERAKCFGVCRPLFYFWNIEFRIEVLDVVKVVKLICLNFN